MSNIGQELPGLKRAFVPLADGWPRKIRPKAIRQDQHPSSWSDTGIATWYSGTPKSDEAQKHKTDFTKNLKTHPIGFTAKPIELSRSLKNCVQLFKQP